MWVLTNFIPDSPSVSIPRRSLTKNVIPYRFYLIQYSSSAKLDYGLAFGLQTRYVNFICKGEPMNLFNKTLATALALQLATVGAFAQSAQIDDAERIQKTEAKLNAKKDQLIQAITTASNHAIEITHHESKKVATYAALRNYELLYAQLWRTSLLPQPKSLEALVWLALDTYAISNLATLSTRILVQPGRAVATKAVTSITESAAEVATKEVSPSIGRRIALTLDSGIVVTLAVVLAYDIVQQGYVWVQLSEKDLDVVRAETFAKIQSLQAELNAMK